MSSALKDQNLFFRDQCSTIGDKIHYLLIESKFQFVQLSVKRCPEYFHSKIKLLGKTVRLATSTTTTQNVGLLQIWNINGMVCTELNNSGKKASQPSSDLISARRTFVHWWKKGLQSLFVKPISPGCSNRD
jgi:hypothetical protein